MFSIIIPTLNNLEYLRLCIKSLRNNSSYNHQIIPHVNIGQDGTVDFLEKENIQYTFTKHNAGICEGMNMASKKAKNDFILYAHDDFYFCPEWDLTLKNEIDEIGHNKFYLSGIMMNNGPLKFDCGDSLENFNESKLLENYKNINHYDFQGSTWAPHLIHKDLSSKIIKFSNDNKLRRKIAKKGRDKYFKYFNSTVVADFIINKTFGTKKKFYWEND